MSGIQNGGGKQADKVRDRPRVDDHHRLFSRSRSNIGQFACCCELEKCINTMLSCPERCLTVGQTLWPISVAKPFAGKRKVSKEKTRENHLTGRASCGPARNSTNRGTTPQAMTRSMGGLRPLESSLRNILVARS